MEDVVDTFEASCGPGPSDYAVLPDAALVPDSIKGDLIDRNADLYGKVTRWLQRRGKHVHLRHKVDADKLSEITQCFQLMDGGGTGMIDREALRNALELLGISLDKDQVSDLLEGREEVGFHDFVGMMTGPLKHMAEENTDAASRLPFALAATSYRRKKIMDCLEQRDVRAIRQFVSEAQQPPRPPPLTPQQLQSIHRRSSSTSQSQRVCSPSKQIPATRGSSPLPSPHAMPVPSSPRILPRLSLGSTSPLDTSTSPSSALKSYSRPPQRGPLARLSSGSLPPQHPPLRSTSTPLLGASGTELRTSGLPDLYASRRGSHTGSEGSGSLASSPSRRVSVQSSSSRLSSRMNSFDATQSGSNAAAAGAAQQQQQALKQLAQNASSPAVAAAILRSAGWGASRLGPALQTPGRIALKFTRPIIQMQSGLALLLHRNRRKGVSMDTDDDHQRPSSATQLRAADAGSMMGSKTLCTTLHGHQSLDLLGTDAAMWAEGMEVLVGALVGQPADGSDPLSTWGRSSSDGTPTEWSQQQQADGAQSALRQPSGNCCFEASAPSLAPQPLI